MISEFIKIIMLMDIQIIFIMEKLFLKTLNIGSSLYTQYDKWYDTLNGTTSMNVETLIKTHFQFEGIWDNVNFYDQVMYLVKSKDTFARWSTGIWDDKQQLFIKYPPEYTSSVKSCNANLNYIEWLLNWYILPNDAHIDIIFIL